MNLPIVFRLAARSEFDSAADWYEQRRVGLGAAFTAAVQRVLDQVSAHPKFYPHAYRDIRESLVPGYP